MTLKRVLDTNCIIDLEENRHDAQHIRTLIGAWKDGRVDLAVVAVSASENRLGGSAGRRNYSDFEAKLSNVGLSGVRHLLPLAIWDVFYWDHALWSSDEMEKLASRIRSILFPSIPIAPPTNIENNSVWRNNMCDVLIAWSCIHHGWGCLVTRDKNFHDHKQELANLGLREIFYPADAYSD
jgi:predicted nucleic acid-binding protein